MITDKIIRGAGSHRILLSLLESPKTSKELRRLVGAVNSTSRFNGEYMERLRRNGFVILDVEHWLITSAGREKLQQLGVKKQLNRTPPRFAFPMRPLIPEKQPPRRPGALDLMDAPSRVGPTLYYKDGTRKPA